MKYSNINKLTNTCRYKNIFKTYFSEYSLNSLRFPRKWYLQYSMFRIGNLKMKTMGLIVQVSTNESKLKRKKKRK